MREALVCALVEVRHTSCYDSESMILEFSGRLHLYIYWELGLAGPPCGNSLRQCLSLLRTHLWYF